MQAHDKPSSRYTDDGYVYFYNTLLSNGYYLLMPRPVKKFIVRLRMWYATMMGHKGMRWDYEPSEHYFGRKRK